MKKSLRIAIIAIVLLLIFGVFLLRRYQERPIVEEVIIEERIPLEFTVFSMEEFLSPGLPLLLDLGSEGCGPCRAMKPDLEAFYEETYGKVTVRYADIWEDSSLTGGLPAMAVPVQYFFHSDGSPYVPSEELMNELGFYMYTLRDSGEHVLTCHYGMISKDALYRIFREMGAEI